MSHFRHLTIALVLSCFWMPIRQAAPAETGESTRVTDPNRHARTDTDSYPYRAKADYILKELDLRPGDVVADVGAGDGWWAERMVKFVGETGVIHAGEVDKKKVEEMKKKFADAPQVKAYLCPKTNTGLPENSCDLAFFSQSYHHLDRNGHVDYLRHLRKVLKPTGRVVVIEKHAGIATRGKDHGTLLSELIKQAEEAGWIAARTELMTGTYHYLAIFVQQDLFPPEPEPPKKEESKPEKKEEAP